MSKFLMAALLASLTIFPTDSSTRKSPSAAYSSATTKVTVLFSGLMVFHKEPVRPGYEVGILTPEVAHNHKFSVSYDGFWINNLPNSSSWTLEITNSAPTTGIPPVEIGHGGRRRPDSPAGQHDFSWLIDLESAEFHGTKLDLKPGLLRPIIHLPSGRLYTRFKSIDLLRWQGSSDSASEFGFVPETIALDLELRKGQDLVLKNDDAGGEEIFRLGKSSHRPHNLIVISNVRHPASENSDFGHYYSLFNGIPTEQQYDFRPNTRSQLAPYNPFPVGEQHAELGSAGSFVRAHYKPVTCCMMACTSVLLGKRTEPLR